MLRAECSPARSQLPFGVVSEFVREAVGVTSDRPSHDVERHVAVMLRSASPPAERDSCSPTALAELVTGQSAWRPADDEDVGYRRKLIFTGVRYLFARRSPAGNGGRGQSKACSGAIAPGLELLTRALKRRDKLPILAPLRHPPRREVASAISRSFPSS